MGCLVARGALNLDGLDPQVDSQVFHRHVSTGELL